jgi:hypothetical protein
MRLGARREESKKFDQHLIGGHNERSYPFGRVKARWWALALKSANATQ